MAQKRAKQREVGPHALINMTAEELLKTYFENGGYMTKDGFNQPGANSYEAMTVSFSLGELLSTKSGHRLLIKTLDTFHAGKIDKYGQPVKPVKVTRRKVKIKKTSKGKKK